MAAVGRGEAPAAEAEADGDVGEDVLLLVDRGALSVETMENPNAAAGGSAARGGDARHPPLIYSLIVFGSAFFASLQYCIVLPSCLAYAEELDGPLSPGLTAGLTAGLGVRLGLKLESRLAVGDGAVPRV